MIKWVCKRTYTCCDSDTSESSSRGKLEAIGTAARLQSSEFEACRQPLERWMDSPFHNRYTDGRLVKTTRSGTDHQNFLLNKGHYTTPSLRPQAEAGPQH